MERLQANPTRRWMLSASLELYYRWWWSQNSSFWFCFRFIGKMVGNSIRPLWLHRLSCAHLFGLLKYPLFQLFGVFQFSLVGFFFFRGCSNTFLIFRWDFWQFFVPIGCSFSGLKGGGVRTNGSLEISQWCGIPPSSNRRSLWSWLSCLRPFSFRSSVIVARLGRAGHQQLFLWPLMMEVSTNHLLLHIESSSLTRSCDSSLRPRVTPDRNLEQSIKNKTTRSQKTGN